MAVKADQLPIGRNMVVGEERLQLWRRIVDNSSLNGLSYCAHGCCPGIIYEPSQDCGVIYRNYSDILIERYIKGYIGLQWWQSQQSNIDITNSKYLSLY